MGRRSRHERVDHRSPRPPAQNVVMRRVVVAPRRSRSNRSCAHCPASPESGARRRPARERIRAEVRRRQRTGVRASPHTEGRSSEPNKEEEEKKTEETRGPARRRLTAMTIWSAVSVRFPSGPSTVISFGPENDARPSIFVTPEFSKRRRRWRLLFVVVKTGQSFLCHGIV